MEIDLLHKYYLLALLNYYNMLLDYKLQYHQAQIIMNHLTILLSPPNHNHHLVVWVVLG